MEEDDHHTITEQDSNKKKKKRKLKTKEETQTEEHDIPMEDVNPEEEPKEERKKKKKKRKREEEEEDTVPVPEPPSINMKIQIIPDQDETTAPFVGYFPSGFNPQKNSGEDGVEVKVFRKKDKPKRLQLVVSPKGSTVNFVGASHSGEPAHSQVCNYRLCVVDKDTQTLKIVPIAANMILRLEPVVVVSDLSHNEQPKELNEEDATTKKSDQINLLTSKYGTKKANREAKKDANLNRAEDAKTQKALDEKVSEVQVNKEALETSIGVPARNIPPHDSTADTPEKAYPLDQIILKGEWDYLLDILELVQSDAEITADSYPSFVFNRIHKLREIKDEADQKKLACIFSYIAHLIKFKEQLSARRGSTPAQIPNPLYVKFSSLFGKYGHSSHSDERTDLIISYVLVLTLIADGYLTDPSDIATDLKMAKLSLKQHYEVLGCKPKVTGGVKHYTLPVPLNLPKLNMRRRRR